MAIEVENILDSYMEIQSIQEEWIGQRFEWVKRLCANRVGAIGELIWTQYLLECMCTVEKIKKSSGKGDFLISGEIANFRLDNAIVEVKTATLSRSNDLPIVSWKNIDAGSEFTHLCCIVVFPNHVYIFFMPKEDAFKNCKPQNKTFQISHRKLKGEWLEKYCLQELPDEI